MIYEAPAIESHQPIADPLVLGVPYSTPTWTDEESGPPAIYERPVVAFRQPIADPLVLGFTYKTPTWSDQAEPHDRDR